MSRAKQASKRKSIAVPLLGAAGLSLSLVGGTSAATLGSAADAPERNPGVNHEVALSEEEELFDVSLATFYLFDKENNPGTFRSGLRVAAMGGGCGGCGFSGCWTGTYYTSSVVGNNANPPPQAAKHARKHTHAPKRKSVKKNP